MTQDDIAELLEIDEIIRLKHAYFRLLDTKRFDELGTLLTEDATSSYDSGQLSFEGRDAIVAFLGDSLGDLGFVTMHHGHHPEITLTSPSSATGRWYLEDRLVIVAHDFELHGTALYRDEYRKVDGHWRISHTGYDRIFEERRKRSTGEVHSFVSGVESLRTDGGAGGPAPRRIS
ncbi:MAG TPA: nuclear transport factor 2 family protein [Acidimicrobiales bacterium]|nr:nuclear transport factor 2 family protein [Acidimicrobiales bacterium]